MLYISKVNEKQISVKEVKNGTVINDFVASATYEASVGDNNTVLISGIYKDHPGFYCNLDELVINGVPAPTDRVEAHKLLMDFIGSFKQGGGASGNTPSDHNGLTGRDASDCHPASSVSGLQELFDLVDDALTDIEYTPVVMRANNLGYLVCSFSVVAGGSGYGTGASVSANGVRFIVTEVDAGQSVKKLVVFDRNAVYATDPKGDSVEASGGSGTGLKVKIESIYAPGGNETLGKIKYTGDSDPLVQKSVIDYNYAVQEVKNHDLNVYRIIDEISFDGKKTVFSIPSYFGESLSDINVFVSGLSLNRGDDYVIDADNRTLTFKDVFPADAPNSLLYKINDISVLWYGVIVPENPSAEGLIRIGNPALHASLPVQSKMRSCVLKDDGAVNYYLNPNDSGLKADGSPADLSGADGQVMVEIPGHFRKMEQDGENWAVMISEVQLPGFVKIPMMYVSSYEATVKRDTNMLSSVMNMDVNYRGGSNKADLDGTYKSQLGKPISGSLRATDRTRARKRGAGAQWNVYDYAVHKALSWLYCIEYANLNCQAPFESATDSKGFKQGGLGEGATGVFTGGTGFWGEWYKKFGLEPVIPCGVTNGIGDNSGEVIYRLDVDGDGSDVRDVPVCRYRGIENLFGHIPAHMDGLNLMTTDPEAAKAYVCRDPSKYTDSISADYVFLGSLPRNSGTIKRMGINEDGDLWPVETVSPDQNSLYWRDAFADGRVGTHVSIPAVGGNVCNGSGAGLHFLSSSSIAWQNGGTRLCFIPKD